MSDPTYVGSNIYGFICDRAPTASEPSIDSFLAGFNGIGLSTTNWLLDWWNRSDDTHYLCVDQTSDALVWQQIVTA